MKSQRKKQGAPREEEPAGTEHIKGKEPAGSASCDDL